MPSPILTVRSQTTIEEIDYVYLVTTLQEWAAPRNVISRMVNAGDIIRVKKGIYVFGPNYAKRPYSLEILANKVYGPSYLSREYALSFWGIIPEGVKEVTCSTTGKNKSFSTPVGRFSYHHLSPIHYAVGITYVKITPEVGALIATPEKALCDLLISRKEKKVTKESLKRILFDDLRIEEERFYNFDGAVMTEIAETLNHPTLHILSQLLREKS